MNREEFIESIENTYSCGLELIKIKNMDYANSDDPFRNFKNAEMVGVGIERAMLVRVADKLARVSNLLDKEASVTDESLEDTLIDMCNYLAILKAYRERKGIEVYDAI